MTGALHRAASALFPVAFLVAGGVAAAPNGHYPLEEFKPSIDDNKASLQRGAKYFVNYCMGCHSAKYSRYKRVGKDLGLTDAMMRENMMFAGQRIGHLMKGAMSDRESREWFGAAAPDLTLVSRSRGPAWVYTYLKSFYLDDSRPMGINNALLQNTAMPHVLWRLQGWQKPVFGDDGNGLRTVRGFELVEPGLLSEEEYAGVVRDIVNFMVYLGEPAALKRKNTGIGVMLFLLLLLVLALLLKREYWKSVR